MILKSFYRKKSSKIYIWIFVILFLALLLIHSFINYLNNEHNKNLMETSLLYIEDKNDIYTNLKNDKYITNIKRGLLVDYNEYDENNMKLYIKKGMLSTYLLNNKILVYSDNTLNNDEIVIYLNNLSYFSNKDSISVDLSKNIIINNLKFNIKDIKQANNYSYIKISNEKFNIMYETFNKYVYTANINDNTKYQEIYLKYDELADKCIFLYEPEDESSLNSIKTTIDVLNIFNYILIIVLVIVVIVTTKNIIEDMQKNISLEYKLGFKVKNIKFNILKRLISLHLLSLALSMLLYIILVLLINNIFKISLGIWYISIMYIIFLVILICDLLLCITHSNKNIK